jgi:serine/threonine-protein kinase
VVLGTACYMAPEQAAGRSRDIGPATDVYGLGAILYSALTCRPPIDRGSWAVVLERVRTQEPTEPRRLRPDVDRDLEAVCLKCLEKKPARRYASAEALADDLRRYLDGRPTEARPLSRVGRAWRSVRRHPLACAAVVLLLLAAVAMPVLSVFRDPDRIPKRNLARLERGETVTLVGPVGPPSWQNNLIGQVDALTLPDTEGAFAVGTSGEAAYLELLPATPRRGYRFRAEFRQVDLTRTGKVGLYFAHSYLLTAKGTEHCFCQFTFTDRMVEGGRRGAGENKAGLMLLRWAPARPTQDTGTGIVKPFRPAADEGAGVRRWRPLEVLATPQFVRAYWDGEFVGQVACEQMVERFQDMINRAHDPAVYEPALTPDFGPGGGLGLVIEDTSVLVRNITVGPADDLTPRD